MPKARFNYPVRGNFIDGEFIRPDEPNGDILCKSPGDLSDEIGRFPYSYQSVEEAVASARKAFTSWRKTSLASRAELLKKYQAALKKREEELMEMIAREVGKPLWESKTEVTAMVNKIDVTINESMRFVQDSTIPNVMPETTGATRFRPHGVMAVIGPFNFPGHLPNGHIVPSLLTGNTVIFKPSEKSPMVGQLMAECFQEAGLPKGVFNLLHGEKEVGRRLCVHEGLAGILFTGSYEVGTRIKQDTLLQHWKILALEMGGKNTTIVWDDANLDLAIHETLISAYITAGQRCSATSRVIVHNKLLDQFISKFHERAKAFSIGHPLENAFMGPVIDGATVDRYLKFLGVAAREGAEVVMRGKALELNVRGNYVAPSICWVKDASVDAAKKSIYQQT
jgi:succinylglutamic semialdehyde dehydrogenase